MLKRNRKTTHTEHLISACFVQGKDLLTQKIPVWQQACSDPNKLPERAMLLAQQMGSAAVAGTSPLHTSKSNLVISDPIPGATPLPVPPELAVFMGSGLGHSSVRGGAGLFSFPTDCPVIPSPNLHIYSLFAEADGSRRDVHGQRDNRGPWGGVLDGWRDDVPGEALLPSDPGPGPGSAPEAGQRRLLQHPARPPARARQEQEPRG